MAAYSIGDVAAQLTFSKQRRLPQKFADVDGLRVLRMALYGALWCGPVGHHFYAGLDKVRTRLRSPCADSVMSQAGILA